VLDGTGSVGWQPWTPPAGRFNSFVEALMPTPWLRLWDGTLDLPKAQRLSAEHFKGWINLLMLANRQNDRGRLPDMDEIAFALRTDHASVKSLVDSLVKVKLIDRNGQTMTMHDWQTWQSPEKTNADRAREWRRGKALNERTASAQDERTNERTKSAPRAPDQSREEQIREEQSPPYPPFVPIPNNPENAPVLKMASERWGASNGDKAVGDLLREFPPAWVKKACDAAWDKFGDVFKPAYIRGTCQGYWREGGPKVAENGHSHAEPEISLKLQREMEEWDAKHPPKS
jgi:hypothetical protein